MMFCSKEEFKKIIRASIKEIGNKSITLLDFATLFLSAYIATFCWAFDK